MDWLVLLCLLAALSGAGYGWYSEARKGAEEMMRRLAEQRSAT
jgi:hypothetical protein